MVAKAMLANTVTGDLVPVLFNPEEYVVDRQTNYAQTPVPGLSVPVLQFVSGGARSLALELFIDSREEHREGSRVVVQANEDVRRLTRLVLGFMEIDPTTHAPPPLVFSWGGFELTCVLARCTQRFTLFRDDGAPLRARLEVLFTEYKNTELEAREVKRETADFTKRHIVADGESLAGLAAREYRDPRLWRAIAVRNGIDRPRRLAPGGRLELPRLPYRDPLTGRLFGTR